MAVTAEQRHTRTRPCPICGGHGGLPSGKGVRCAGFTSPDGKWAFCDQVADGSHHEVTTASGTSYAHLLRDEPLHGLNGSSVTFHARPVGTIEREIKAIDLRAESAQSAEEYEADRKAYNRLWDELMQVKAAKDGPSPDVAWVGLSEMNKPLPPIEWLCEGLKLAMGPISCLAGYGYSGKTAIAQNLLLCIATGKPLFGLFKVAQMPVGWMDYEQGWRMSAGRLQRQARGLGVDLSSYPSNSLRYAEFPDVYLNEKGDGVDKIARAVDGMGLCLLDSAKALTPGIDENDSRIRIPFDALSRVTMKTGCVFLLIHHYGKSGGADGKVKPLKERMRGSSALFDAMQMVWGLEARAKEKFTRAELSKDRVTSCKDMEFGVQFVDDVERDAVTLVHLEPEQMKGPRAVDVLADRILAAVREEPGLSANGICARVTGNRQNILQVLKELEAVPKGGVRKEPGGGYRSV